MFSFEPLNALSFHSSSGFDTSNVESKAVVISLYKM